MNINLNTINRINSLQFNEEPYIVKTPIDGLILIRRPQYNDNRGFFQEEFRIKDICDCINRSTLVAQSQLSFSNLNVLRGIHAEPWDKFITPLTGRILNVVVDLRPVSKTFKNWIGFEFDQTDQFTQKTTLFVPEGCGNSMLAFKNYKDKGDQKVIYQYSSSDLYDPQKKSIGLVWHDPNLDIPWPVKNPVVTKKDSELPFLHDLNFT